MAMREHGKLRFNPVLFLLTLAFADEAFFGLNSLEALEFMNPDGTESIRILWKSSVANESVLRMITRSGGVSKRALTRETFCRLFKTFVRNASYCEIITIHALRRGLANKVDSKPCLRQCVLTDHTTNAY